MAYGIQKPQTFGGSVAPKVQGTGMAPRQQAINRALNRGRPQLDEVNLGGGRNQGRPNLTVPNSMGNNGPRPTGSGQRPGDKGKLTFENPMAPPPQTTAPGPAGPPGPVDIWSTGDPELDKYLAGDDVYQQVIASIQRNKDTNKAAYDTNVSNLNTDNETIKRRLAEKEVKDNSLLSDDYAARGMFGSGLNAKAQTDLGQSYQDQYTDLASSLQRNLQQLLTDFEGGNAMDDETRRQAMQDAITRRAQEYGITGGPTIDSKDKNKDKNKGDKKNDGKKNDGKKNDGKGKSEGENKGSGGKLEEVKVNDGKKDKGKKGK